MEEENTRQPYMYMKYCILYFTSVIHSITKQVFWKRLYRPTSGTERDTLCQLRNSINRRNVSGKPKSVNAAEDFVEVITIAHILTAVVSYLEMSELSDTNDLFCARIMARQYHIAVFVLLD